jgi:hypothetical protein
MEAHKLKWTTYDNQLLIDLHKKAGYNYNINKKTSQIYKYLNKFCGFVSIISSSIATTIFLIKGSDSLVIDEDFSNGGIVSVSDVCDKSNIAITFLSFTILSTILQNITNLTNISNEYKDISKQYYHYKNIIETVGDINPNKRNGSPKMIIPIIRYKLNKLSENKKSVPCCFSSILERIYKNEVNKSYLIKKHEDFSVINENENPDEQSDEIIYTNVFPYMRDIRELDIMIDR